MNKLCSKIYKMLKVKISQNIFLRRDPYQVWYFAFISIVHRELSSEQRTVCLNLDLKSGLSASERHKDIKTGCFRRKALGGKEKCLKIKTGAQISWQHCFIHTSSFHSDILKLTYSHISIYLSGLCGTVWKQQRFVIQLQNLHWFGRFAFFPPTLALHTGGKMVSSVRPLLRNVWMRFWKIYTWTLPPSTLKCQEVWNENRKWFNTFPWQQVPRWCH